MPDRNATVEIARSEHGLQFRLVDDGGKYPDGPDFVSFKPTKAGLPPLSSRTNVEKYARAITRALSRHEAVQKELEQIFYTTSPDRASLEFVIATPEGERYRWETLLSEPNRFLALSGLCSMKRIAGTSSAAPGLRIFAWPIQVTAFLSASGVSAAKEFRAVTDGVCAARAQGLDIEATVYLGEEDLLAEARGAIRRRKLPGVHLAPIPDSAIGIEKVLKSKPPQILHCFCHGYAEAGVELLEFASINDHDTDARVGSINFSADRLIEALRAGDATWLTVLNSCSGAAAMPQVFSMAAGLAKSSSPVAIGMAEPLRSDDANLFASAFYRSAMQILADNLRSLQVGDTTRIDLAPAVDEARKVLYDQGDLIPDAGDFGRWSLPVLYQRRGPLKIGCAADDAMCERIFMVARALRGITARTPPEVRATMLALLVKPPPVPPALRPDQFGEFP